MMMISDCKNKLFYCNLLHTCNIPLKSNWNSTSALPRMLRHVSGAVCNQTEREEEEGIGEDQTRIGGTRWNQLSLETKGCALHLCAHEYGRGERADPGSEVNYQGRLCCRRVAAYIKYGPLARLSVGSELSKRHLRALLPLWFFSPALRKIDDNGSEGEAGIVTAYWTTDGRGVEVNISPLNRTADFLWLQSRSLSSKTFNNCAVWVVQYHLRVWKAHFHWLNCTTVGFYVDHLPWISVWCME